MDNAIRQQNPLATRRVAECEKRPRWGTGPGRGNGRRKGPADGPVATALDELVGRKIQQRRTSLRISRDSLARTVGISARELEAFELGQRRAGAQMLAKIAKALDVGVAWFFVRSDD
jgi:DNA-binding XRE family transcriptional regulator